MILYRTPGRSFTRPPRTSTIECSCRLCPTPGMYAVTSIWLVSRTRATFRSAEFGFLGVVVYTRVHTPRRCGLPLSAGVLVLLVFAWRPLRTNCWMVGIRAFVSLRPPGWPHRLATAFFDPRGRACRPIQGPGRTRDWPDQVNSLRRPTRRTHVEPGRARARGEREPTHSAQVKTGRLSLPRQPVTSRVPCSTRCATPCQWYPVCPGAAPGYRRAAQTASTTANNMPRMATPTPL